MAGRAAVAAGLVMCIFAPALPGYADLATSATLGTCLGAAALITAFVGLLVPQRAWVAPLELGALIIGAVIVHGFIAALILPFDFLRGGGSLLPLVLMIFGGFALAKLLAVASDRSIHSGVRQVFVLMVVVALLAIAGLEPPSPSASNKPMFPYTEPSHYALVFTPLLMYRCVFAHGLGRWLLLAIGFGTGILMQNLTLVVGCLLIGCVCLRAAGLIFLGGLLVAALLTLDVSYYTSRLDLSEDTTNLSTLVYLQGWQLLFESMARSAGWGVGFQQLGLAGSEGSANTMLTKLIGDSSNLFDGGFTLAKTVGEFGVIGIVLVMGYLRVAWRSLRVLRMAAQRRAYPGAAVALACSTIVAYAVELFLRGQGFFTPSSMLLIAAFWVIYLQGRAAAESHDVAGTDVEEGAAPLVGAPAPR